MTERRRLLAAALALLPACLPALELAPCYSTADCAAGNTCIEGACTPDLVTCTVGTANDVKIIRYPHTGDGTPSAAFAHDGTRYWAVVEVGDTTVNDRYELYTVKLDAQGSRDWPTDVPTRSDLTGHPIGPMLKRGPSGLIAAWNERPPAGGAYVGFTGALGADGKVTAPRAFDAELQNLVLVGNDVFGSIRYQSEGVSALQQIGTSTIHRFDPQLATVDAVRNSDDEWLSVAESGDDIGLVRLRADYTQLGFNPDFIDGSTAAGEVNEPRAVWTGDRLVVFFLRPTPTGSVLHLIEADGAGAVIANSEQTLTTTTVRTNYDYVVAYSAARDELAVAYSTPSAVELLRVSRRTGARVVQRLSTPDLPVPSEGPILLDNGAEYLAGWLEPAGNDGYMLKTSRVACP